MKDGKGLKDLKGRESGGMGRFWVFWEELVGWDGLEGWEGFGGKLGKTNKG